jgi:hypothetical protein
MGITVESNISVHDLSLWSQIYNLRGERVVVLAQVQGTERAITGVLRHVVEPHHDGFASRWTPASRLRITNAWDAFIPLADVLAVAKDD